MTVAELKTLFQEKRFEAVEEAFGDALEAPLANADLLLAALQGLSRTGQKALLQKLASSADSLLKGGSEAQARLRWELLKEAVKGGGTPSTPDGFHKLFEEAIGAAYPGSPSLPTLLGRFKFREAKVPLDGMARLEKVEKWLPFEVGRVFALPGRGPGKVVEMNFALDSIRIDFEKAKGIAIPIGVAAKGMIPLPEGPFLREKLTNPAPLSEAVQADPTAGLKRVIDSYGRNVAFQELKEAIAGLVAEDKWNAWWTSARKHPQVVLHGSGKNATIEWSASAGQADDVMLSKFEKAPPEEQLDFFRKHSKRSADLASRLGKVLATEADRLRGPDPAEAFAIAVAIEKVPGVSISFSPDDLVPTEAVPFLARLSDRVTRERAIEVAARRDPAAAPKLFADWFMKEEDVRTLDLLSRRLLEGDPVLHAQVLDRLLKNPKQGPRAFYWFAQEASENESFRSKLNPSILARLLDALSWPELSAVRVKIREMFDRTGIVASWLMKQATLPEAQSFLEVLGRNHDLEYHRRHGLVKAAEMRFPELRKTGQDEEPFFVTPEALEARRHELDHVKNVEIPENAREKQIAAAEGDLSENFEYKARIEKQQVLAARAARLQQQLSLARALDPATIDTTEVRPGTKLTLTTLTGERVVTLLGPWDSEPEKDIYSYLSDLGKALLGRKPGESVQILGVAAVISKIEAWR